MRLCVVPARWVVIGLAVLAVGGGSGLAWADGAGTVRTWTGDAQNSNFGTAGNWSGGVVPGAGDTAFFNSIWQNGIQYPSGIVNFYPAEPAEGYWYVRQDLGRLVVGNDDVLMGTPNYNYGLILELPDGAEAGLSVAGGAGETGRLTLNSTIYIYSPNIDIGTGDGATGSLRLGNAYVQARPFDWMTEGTVNVGNATGSGEVIVGYNSNWAYLAAPTLTMTNAEVKIEYGWIQSQNIQINESSHLSLNSQSSELYLSSVDSVGGSGGWGNVNWSKGRITIQGDLSTSQAGMKSLLGGGGDDQTLDGQRWLQVEGTTQVADGTTLTIAGQDEYWYGDYYFNPHFSTYGLETFAAAPVPAQLAENSWITLEAGYGQAYQTAEDVFLNDYVAGASWNDEAEQWYIPNGSTVYAVADSDPVSAYQLTAAVTTQQMVETTNLKFVSGGININGSQGLEIGPSGPIRDAANGDLTLSRGKNLGVSAEVNIQNGATLTLSGGKLNVGAVNRAAAFDDENGTHAAGVFDYQHGSLHLQSQDVEVGPGGLLSDGDVTLASLGWYSDPQTGYWTEKTMSIYTERNTVIRPGFTLTIDGGTLQTLDLLTESDPDGVLADGQLVFNSGTLTLNRPDGIQVGPGGTLADGDLTLGSGRILNVVTANLAANSKIVVDGGTFNAYQSLTRGQGAGVEFHTGNLALGGAVELTAGGLLGAGLHTTQGSNVYFNGDTQGGTMPTLTVKSDGVVTVGTQGSTDWNYLYAAYLKMEAGATFHFYSGTLGLGATSYEGGQAVITLDSGGALADLTQLTANKSLILYANRTDLAAGSFLKINGGYLSNSNGSLHLKGGATLLVSGGTFNTRQLQIEAGAQLNYTGGAFNGGQVTNQGTINASVAAGQQTLTGQINNQGWMNVLGVSTDPKANVLTIAGALTNNKSLNVTFATLKIDGPFTNNGTMNVFEGAIYVHDFINNGLLISDPSEFHLTNLIVTANGAIQGEAGDIFIIEGDFTNEATDATAWDAKDITFHFAGAGTHNIVNPEGFAAPLGKLVLDAGGQLEFTGPLVVAALVLPDGLEQLTGLGEQTIRADQITLGGDTYNLHDEGDLIALNGLAGGEGAPFQPRLVPEPGTLALLAMGWMGMIRRRR
ncbi:MAG: PEP-CTERM sorting domain-containing protein [Phycisphaeraceae bacterium]|nr:PEP-CTERM sorting domain-containing protein [Phycisphaeraceae bacterium]